MRQAAEVMGTVVSLDVPGCDDDSVFLEAYSRLKDIDARFSTYKKDSEVSRYRRGELSDSDISAEFKAVMTACADFEKQTAGYFSPNFAGKYDPTGYVKAYAINEAAQIINKAGYKTFCIGVGGDILASSDGEKKWGIGIQNPADKDSIIGVIRAKNMAVATSGNYERGAHIINPKSGRPADELLSFTVVGPGIILADVLATAGFAAGPDALKLLDIREGYEVLAVTKTGQIISTPGMEKLLKTS